MSQKESTGPFYHSYSAEETFKELSSSESGLSQREAESRLLDFGFNEIEGKDKINPVLIFLKQFHSVLIYILIVAALIAWFYGKMIDVYVITAVVFVNAIMGFIQEYRAEKAIEALRGIIVPTARVYRDGILEEIDAKNLVPGDVISLEEGDRIPADARIFELKDFRTVEASLTGESTPTTKKKDKVSFDAAIGDRFNMVWMGTFAAGGQAKAIVVTTGKKTAFGEIAEDLSKIKPKKSHFEIKIDKLAKKMGLIAVAGASLIFVVGIIKAIEFQEVLFFTIASLVSGIPEGLPAVLVIVLAIGANRMTKRNAIIRRLAATETLGVTDLISTDKTGTLTQNTMNIREIVFADMKNVSVSGSGWEPTGDFFQGGLKISPLDNPALAKLLNIAAICNNAKLVKEKSKDNNYKIIGDPTEASLVVLAQKAGLMIDTLGEKKIDDLSFSSKFKYRASISSITKDKDRHDLYLVGAPEVALERSNYFISEDGTRKRLDEKKRKQIESEISKLTDNAMRTIGLAYKSLTVNHKELSDEIVNNLVFVGAVGMIDPPRPEARRSVIKAQKAGIRVIMTTGDHKGTALAIAKEVGIVKNKEEGAYTEADLLKMSDKEFRKAVHQVNVFARLTPNMKLRIAQSLQEDGHVVAMTGDGVNDAPALKKADIGIAMGVIGTDVARESSEIILADDNFASIVNAIEEGRTVFTNTRQASTFLVTTNFAEHATLIGALFIFAQLPLLPTQILWLNLVTDGVSGFALAAEPGHGDILNEPPRKKNENILSKETLPFLLLMMIVMAGLTISFFAYHLFIDGDIDKARTAAFTVMAFTQIFNALNMRSMKRSLFEIGIFSNKYMMVSISLAIFLQVIAIYFLDAIFHFEYLSFYELILIFVSSSLVLWLGELYKFFKYNKNRVKLLKNN